MFRWKTNKRIFVYPINLTGYINTCLLILDRSVDSSVNTHAREGEARELRSAPKIDGELGREWNSVRAP